MDIWCGKIVAIELKESWNVMVCSYPTDIWNANNALARSIKNEIEITGTFKHRKVELVKEGYDPKNISEPLYFCDHQSKKYIPLDNDLFGSINNQEMKL